MIDNFSAQFTQVLTDLVVILSASNHLITAL